MKHVLLIVLMFFATAVLSADNQSPDDKLFSEITALEQAPLSLIGQQVQAGQRRSLTLTAGQSFFGQPLHIPVTVVHGRKSGPLLCLVAAIHGDELNGIEAVRRLLEAADPEVLSGTLIGIPVVNVLGFAQGSRYLPDRRDLNRHFPGRARGSLASRIAYLLFHNVIQHCDYLVDFHTGSFKRSNLPQLRADLSNIDIQRFAQLFEVPVLHKPARKGTLRAAALNANIPVVTFELGEPNNIQLDDVAAAVTATHRLLAALNMRQTDTINISDPQPKQSIYYSSHWVRVNHGGLLTTATQLGQTVELNELLGTSINPLTNDRYEIKSPVAGIILGMAHNQFMLPGFAAFHIGRHTPNLDTLIQQPDAIPSDDFDDELDN